MLELMLVPIGSRIRQSMIAARLSGNLSSIVTHASTCTTQQAYLGATLGDIHHVVGSTIIVLRRDVGIETSEL